RGHAPGIPGSLFRDPVHDRDLDHGNARALAQCRDALAGTAQAERILRALHLLVDRVPRAGARNSCPATDQTPEVAGLTVTLSTRSGFDAKISFLPQL